MFVYVSVAKSYHILTDFRKNASVDVSPILYLVNQLPYFYTVGDNRIQGSSVIPLRKWTHLVLVRSSESTKLYVDGIQSGSTYSDSNNYVCLEGRPTIGAEGVSTGANGLNGFISNFRVLKGTALYTANFTPPSTAPLTNVTNTKLLCCQSNTSAIEGAVKPGTITANGDAAATNFNPFNTDINTVRGQETGYCTFNPLDKYSGITLSNGNLTLDHSSGSTLPFSRSTIGMSSGKFYFEVTRGSGTYGTMGIATVDSDLSMYAGRDSNAVGGYEIYTENTEKWAGGSGGSSSGYLTVPWDSDGDVASCYFDADNGTIGFKVNGTDMGIAFTGINTSKTYYFQCGSQGTILHANWGQKPFKYAPPEGYLPLNSATVRPETVIVRPDQHVGVTTYTGNQTARKINMGPLAPDLVWIKSRPSSYHILTDSVRGINRQVYSNDTAIGTNSDRLASFNSNGFSLKANASSGGVNTNNYAYVAWCWRAGGSKNTFNVDDVGYATFAASGTTAGTITPTDTSIGTKQGFSIIKYTGTGAAATLPHGLSQAPDFLLVKNLDSSYNWAVYHKDLASAAYYLFLNNSDSQSNNFYTFWNSTDPSSTVISLGADSSDSNVNTNKASQSHICYAWHSVPGLQKFGFYEGNGSTDGPYVELGFRPAVLIRKSIDSTRNWSIVDSKRNAFNPMPDWLRPDTSDSETGTGYTDVDFLSNGFKVRTDGAVTNSSSTTYIYAAWAEAPASNLFGGQSNAR